MKNKLVFHGTIFFVSLIVFLAHPLPTKAAWYDSDRIIVHAGGEINGCTYTNSKEALTESLQQGEALIELDFVFTKDNVLVCRHGWKDKKNKKGKPKTYSKFKKEKTEGGYTPMAASEAIELLSKYPNTYLIVDTQEKDITRVYRTLKQLCYIQKNMDFLDRMIPQIYRESDYAKIQKVHTFNDWIFSLYKKKPKTKNDYKKIASFCKKNKINVVAIEQNKVSKSIIKIFKKKKIICLAHTVNKRSSYRKLRNMGIYGIYSDNLS